MIRRSGRGLRARVASSRAGAAVLALACCTAIAAAAVASPAAAAPTLAWSAPAPADRSGRPTAVSCPAENLCVAVDRQGSVLTSPDPTAAAPTWTSAPVDAGQEPTAVSCASASLCIVVDAQGNALLSTQPGGGIGAWTSRPIDTGVALTGVSCPTSSLCVAVDAGGDELVSSEPARDIWHTAVEFDHGQRPAAVSCATASLCVAVDSAGGVLTSAEPAAGVTGAWRRRQLDPAGGLVAVSCSSYGVCVAVDTGGEVLASSDPTALAPTWSATDLGQGLAAVSCAPSGTCVAVGGGQALASEAPAGPAPGWGPAAVDGEALAGVSCAAGPFCLALDVAGRSLSASLPPPPGAGTVLPPPVPRPSILGTPALGSRLACQSGVTVGAQVQLSFQWLRESEPIAGASAPDYTVGRGDEGRHLQCRVTALDAAGRASATSGFVTVPFQGLPVAAAETLVGAAHARGDRIAVPIACSSRAPHGCAILLRLVWTAGHGGATTIGGSRIHVARGARITVTTGLSSVGRRLLARRHRLGALLLASGTVIGSIQAALSEQRLIFSQAGRRTAVRVVSACRSCRRAVGLSAPQAGLSSPQAGMSALHVPLFGASGGGVRAGRSAARRAARGLLAATPYMGWDSYLAFGPDYSESTALEQASDLLTLGLARRGYRYVWLDVGWWQGARAGDGQIALDRAQWPHGMAWLASTLHHAGLLLGLYTDAGANGCGGVGQGSYGHYRQDADTFAAWGVDAVKVDFCGGAQLGLNPARAYREFRSALDSTPSRRPVLLSICDFLQPGERVGAGPPIEGSAFSSYLFGPEVGNSWRTDGDIGVPGHVPFANVLRNLDADAADPQAAGPGHWNDPDYLGPDQGMGPQQFRTQLSMWAMLAAPLMVSRDLGRISAGSLGTLRDEEVLAVDQDPLGAQGTLVSSEGETEVWVKPLSDGSRAVALLDRGPTSMRIATSASAVGLPAARRYTLRDLWRRASTATSGPIAAQVPGDGTVLLRVSAAG